MISSSNPLASLHRQQIQGLCGYGVAGKDNGDTPGRFAKAIYYSANIAPSLGGSPVSSADASKIAINLVRQRSKHKIAAIKILVRSPEHLIQCHACASCVSTACYPVIPHGYRGQFWLILRRMAQCIHNTTAFQPPAAAWTIFDPKKRRIAFHDEYKMKYSCRLPGISFTRDAL